MKEHSTHENKNNLRLSTYKAWIVESWCVLALLVAAVYSAYASDSDKTGVRILFWQSLSTTKGDCPQTWMGHGNY